ncbi:Endoglucanase E-2 precursor [compost metagenome]
MTSPTEPPQSRLARPRFATWLGIALLALGTSLGFALPPERPSAARHDAFLFEEESPAYGIYGATGGTWLTGSTWDVQTVERVARHAEQTGRVPVLVMYAIPGRDLNGPSGGGARNAAEYRRIIERVARAMGKARAIVILEPDALPLGLSPALLREAIALFRTHAPRAELYLDAGHSNWQKPEVMAKRLVEAGIQEAAGFSLNVSAFEWTQNNLDWGERTRQALMALDPALAGKRFVIDTSRNGNGPGVDEQSRPTWGDPVRARNGGPIMAGPRPTFDTGHPHCAAFLWVKTPGFGDNRTRNATTFGGEDWVKPQPSP